MVGLLIKAQEVEDPFNIDYITKEQNAVRTRLKFDSETKEVSIHYRTGKPEAYPKHSPSEEYRSSHSLFYHLSLAKTVVEAKSYSDCLLSNGVFEPYKPGEKDNHYYGEVYHGYKAPAKNEIYESP